MRYIFGGSYFPYFIGEETHIRREEIRLGVQEEQGDEFQVGRIDVQSNRCTCYGFVEKNVGG